MRVLFQKRPSDLFVALLYTTAASLAILLTGQGTLWALLLVLFTPGYVLVAALFPSRGLATRLERLTEEGEQLLALARTSRVGTDAHRGTLARAKDAARTGQLSEAVQSLQGANERLRRQLEERSAGKERDRELVLPDDERLEREGGGIDWTDRIALSFGLSIAIVALLGLLLDLTPWGIRLDGIVTIVLLFTLGVGAIAVRRRIRLPVEDRLSATVGTRESSWLGSSALDKALVAALAASIVFAAGVVAYVAVTPRPVERFTQLYLLDRNGTADPALYPTQLNVSAPGTVVIVVVNNESVTANYTVRVDLVGVQIVRSATTGLNETVEVNRTTLNGFPVNLANGQTWQSRYTFAIAAPGWWKVDFLLFRSGVFPQPYRDVFLLVQVGPPA